jgi:hypothetical protein
MTAAVGPVGTPSRTDWGGIGRRVGRVSRFVVRIVSGHAEDTLHDDRQ